MSGSGAVEPQPITARDTTEHKKDGDLEFCNLIFYHFPHFYAFLKL